MDILETIGRRHSVRSYLDKPIEKDKMDALQALIDECNGAGGLNIRLMANEPKAFSGRMAHYGKFSNVNNYFAMIGRITDDLDEKIGYYGEMLVLEAQQLGLNTCWVGLTYSKNKDLIELSNDEKFVCAIALGYGATQGASHKIKTFEQVSKTDGDVPEWFTKGINAALLAPTALNQQKFRFILEGRQVQAKAGWGFFSKVDLGIVKYHFEIGAGKEHFEWK